MGFRMRKTIKVAPGVRLNLSKTGASWSVGRKGATVNLKNGRARVSVGLPGTGLGYTTTLGGAKVSTAPRELVADVTPTGAVARAWLALKVTLKALIGCALVTTFIGVAANPFHSASGGLQSLWFLFSLMAASAITVAGLQARRYGQLRKFNSWQCTSCGHAGKPMHAPRKWIAWEWAAWSFGIYPGAGLTFYRTFTGKLHCPECNAVAMMPVAATEDLPNAN